MIGVLMSATLPARLGEPARAMVLRAGDGPDARDLGVLLGTLVSQTALNILALGLLGTIIVSTTDLFQSSTQKLFLVSFAPLLLLVAACLAPMVVRTNGRGRIARALDTVRGALKQVRAGLMVFRDLRKGPLATVAQLARLGDPAARLLGAVLGPGAEQSGSAPPRRCCSRST